MLLVFELNNPLKLNKINVINLIIKAAGKINFLDSIRTDWTAKRLQSKKCLTAFVMLFKCKGSKNEQIKTIKKLNLRRFAKP